MSNVLKARIPVIDLQDYTQGSPEARAAFVKTWGDGLTEFGFVSVANHAIDHELIRRAYGLFESFFALPAEVKDRYGKVAGGARGYTSFGKEHAKDSTVGDLKEFWHVGREGGIYPDNVWPAELTDLKTVGLDLFSRLEDTARTLLQALGDYFGLADRGYFADATRGGNSILRAIHYPPLLAHHDPKAVRAAAHEDINMITILCEATSSGLEILTREGDWVAIEALDGQLVVDAGDMLSRTTNQVIPATTHRVVNPEGSNKARYSLPFFVHPYPTFDLSCLPECVSAERPARFPPITAGEFLDQRLREIGLLK